MTDSSVVAKGVTRAFPSLGIAWPPGSGEDSPSRRRSLSRIMRRDSSVAPYDTTTLGVWDKIGGSTVSSEPQTRLISKLFDFARPQEVLRFLDEHTFLIPLLLEAYRKIAEVFGPASTVVLEVMTDPEAPDHRELFAFIRTSLPPDEALRKLDELDQGWWLNEADQARGKLCIHVEFQ